MNVHTESNDGPVAESNHLTRRAFIANNQTPRIPTDDRQPFTPKQLAARWGWHEESIRRALRDRRMASITIGRRRLIPASEVERTEKSGYIARAEPTP